MRAGCGGMSTRVSGCTQASTLAHFQECLSRLKRPCSRLFQNSPHTLQDTRTDLHCLYGPCTEVTGLRQDNGAWVVETTRGEYSARSVVVATGIMTSPVVPDFDGMSSYGGQIFHSTEYRRPDDRPGRRALVVGIGNSGSEIASEMAEAGIEVTVSVRSGANVIPKSIAGIPTQYFGWMMSCVPTPAQRRVVGGMGLIGGLLRPGSARLPRKQMKDDCPDVPVIGRGILDHIEAGRIKLKPGVAKMTEGGVRFSDGSEWVRGPGDTCDRISCGN